LTIRNAAVPAVHEHGEQDRQPGRWLARRIALDALLALTRNGLATLDECTVLPGCVIS